MKGKIAEKVFVRFGFADVVMTLKDAMNNKKEVCSYDSFIVGYEDENGKKCNGDGTYFEDIIIDPNQIDMFDN